MGLPWGRTVPEMEKMAIKKSRIMPNFMDDRMRMS